jgi:hypothetical protein
MSVRALFGRRRSRRFISASAVALATAVVSVAAVNSQAHAESGNRICVYSNKVKPSTYPDPLIQISLVVKHDKKQNCPTVDPWSLSRKSSQKQQDGTDGPILVDPQQVAPNPVPKLTCEDFGKDAHTEDIIMPGGLGMGEDPCLNMQYDVLYAFYWQDPTTPNAKRPSEASYLSIWEYQ